MGWVVERRFSTAQVRTLAPMDFSSSPGTLEGYAATYRTLSADMGGWRERIAGNAFARSLRDGDDVVATINHDPNLCLGRLANKTVELSSDYRGLKARIILPDTSYARDLVQNVRLGNIHEMSFAFQVRDEDWSNEPDPEDPNSRVRVRTLHDVKLLDIAAVLTPAYPNTSISVSSGTPVRSRTAVPLHAFAQLFPEGRVPAEVRSNMLRAQKLSARAQERRRVLVNFVLGL